MEKSFEPTPGREYLRVVRSNLNSIKAYGDKSFVQLNENELHANNGGETNSIAVLIQHISGNLSSRFTDFFTGDGEKPGRNRDAEFIDQQLRKEQLLEKWNASWNVLFTLLDSLTEEDLLRIVYVRNEPHTVMEAINRQVWHYSFHVGQIVVLAKQLKGNEWKNLSIPKKK